MILINKEEATAIREKFPNTNIVRTMKQKSKRHKYYCEENRGVVRFLNSIRNGDKPSVAKGDGYHRDRKKTKRV